MHIQQYSQARDYVREERPPLPFLKIKKIVLDLERKAPILSIFGLNIQFKMQFQEYLEEKTPKCFPEGSSFTCAFDEMFIEVS